MMITVRHYCTIMRFEGQENNDGRVHMAPTGKEARGLTWLDVVFHSKYHLSVVGRHNSQVLGR
jgi:hypothetical protein